MDIEQEANSSTCRRYYRNGAHAGNIYYRVDAWGVNSPEVEAEILQKLDEFITRLQID